MTIAEARRFYDQDEKKYEIEKNKEFMTWLRDSIDNGYHCYISTEELQELIDYLVTWYEIKYPDRELEFYEGTTNLEFLDVKKISNIMNIRQLLFRLPHNQLSLLECKYRSHGGCQTPIYENGKVVGMDARISMVIKKKEKSDSLSYIPYFYIFAEPKTGNIPSKYDIEEYVECDGDITLDVLLKLFDEQCKDTLGYTELKETIYDHNMDIELRNRVLQLAALKLIYSKNTIPERGYIRAKRFIEEFNKKLGTTLSLDEVDEIMKKDYSEDETTIVQEQTVQNSEQKSGIQKLILRFFNEK